jgi:hypothetical protein
VWAGLVREWRESGLSATAFAARRRIRPGTLQWWAYELKRAASPTLKPLEFIEVSREAVAPDQRFEVHLGNGRRVTVPAAFDADALGRLLAVVEGSR